MASGAEVQAVEDEVLPGLPWALRGCRVVQIGMEFPPAVLSHLPARLTPTERCTGGYMIFEAPRASAKAAAYSKLSVWLDVEGHDGSPGAKGRYAPVVYMSGIAQEVMRRSFSVNYTPGRSWQRDEGDCVLAGGGGPNEDYFRVTVRPTGELEEFGIIRRWIGRDSNGSLVVSASPVSGDAWRAEVLDYEVSVPPGHLLEQFQPTRILWAQRLKNVATTAGIDLPDPNDAQQSRTSGLLEYVRVAAVLVSDNHVVEINQAAERLLGDGLVLRQGRLRTSVAEDQAAVDRMIGSVHSSRMGRERSEIATIRRPSGRKPLLARAWGPLPDGTWTNSIVVLIADPERRADANSVPALQLLGLTASEARVASLVGKGLSPQEAAHALDRSVGSIRVNLHAAYEKLEVSRQSELANIVRNLELDF